MTLALSGVAVDFVPDDDLNLRTVELPACARVVGCIARAERRRIIARPPNIPEIGVNKNPRRGSLLDAKDRDSECHVPIALPQGYRADCFPPERRRSAQAAT